VNKKSLFIIVTLTIITASAIGTAWVFDISQEDSNNRVSDNKSEHINEYQAGSAPEWKVYDVPPEKRPDAMESETYEVTRFPNSSPTSENLEYAWRHYNRSYEAAKDKGWFDFEKANEEGYRQFDQIHYVNRRYYLNGENLNPYKPESLIYYDDPQEKEKKVLVGFMYVMDGLDVGGKQFGGPLTVWHYHPRGPENCFAEVLDGGKEFDTAHCSEDDITRPRTPEMIHVWFVKTTEGPFSSGMRVPDGQLSNPEKMTEEEFKSYTERKYTEYFGGK
jgi:hypothetical protein